METKNKPDNRPAIQAALLVAALALPAVCPPLTWWPWHFLGPLLIFAGIVAVIPPLRRSAAWLAVGRLDAAVWAVNAGIIVSASLVLILYYHLFHPDLRDLAEQLPLRTGMPLILAGALFAVTNALAEEIIFRGVLQAGLASQLGTPVAVVIQAVVFGLGHARGYPPGEIGIVLAGLYGLLLGILREWSGGLGAPVLAHVFADATIFAIVTNAT